MQNDELKTLMADGTFEHFWSSILNAIPTVFKSRKYSYFHFDVHPDHVHPISDILLRTGEMFGFVQSKTIDSVIVFTRNDKNLTVSFQSIDELDPTFVWRTLYKPYHKKYGVFTNTTLRTIKNNMASEIKPLIIDGITLPYMQIAVYDSSKTIVNWFTVDKSAADFIKKHSWRFIFQNGKPFASQCRKYAVELLFEKDVTQEYVYINGKTDLRFRSIGVGGFGVKFVKSREQKAEQCKLAMPTYTTPESIDYAKGFRHPNEDIAEITSETDFNY